ncbi:MAG: hypothetical protein WCG47_22640, partial [Dermatophilaceae bacterium]
TYLAAQYARLIGPRGKPRAQAVGHPILVGAFYILAVSTPYATPAATTSSSAITPNGMCATAPQQPQSPRLDGFSDPQARWSDNLHPTTSRLTQRTAPTEPPRGHAPLLSPQMYGGGRLRRRHRRAVKPPR